MLELLWRISSGRPSAKIFGKRLKALSESEIRTLAYEYMSARYAIMQAVWEHELEAGASENTIEDLADWLILGGAEALTRTLAGDPLLPPRDDWSELEQHSLFYELSGEVQRRFAPDSIYDVTGFSYPYPWTTASSFAHVDYLAPTKN